MSTFTIYQLAPDHATYGSDAGRFIVTSIDYEQEYSGPMGEKDARAFADVLDALLTVVEMESDRDEESRNFSEERLQHFTSVLAGVMGVSMASATKRCKRCGEDKPLDQFGLNRAAPDRKFPWCKPCRSRRLLERFAERRQKAAERIA